MEIQVSTTPSAEQILEVLKQRFSDFYTCELFAIGKQKNIFISKSTFTAVRVSSAENRIRIVASSKPSILAVFSGILSVWGFTLEIFSVSRLRGRRKEMVQEVGSFLKERYQ